MKKTLRFFGMLAIMMIASSTASFAADFEGSVNLKAKSDGSAYNTQAAKFSFTDVAATLETDSATLSAALTKFMSGASDSGINFEVEYTDENSAVKTSTSYTQGSPGGFWMNINNEPINWGEGCIWYNTISFQTGEEANDFFINIGLYPGALIDGGGTLKAKFILTYNEKTVSFEVTANVAGKTKLEKEPELTIANLTIVGEASITFEQPRLASPRATKSTVSISDLISKMDLTKEIVNDNLSEMVYVTGWDATNSVLSGDAVVAKDFWLSSLYDEDNGVFTNTVIQGGENESEGTAFKIYDLVYDTDSGDFSFSLLQSTRLVTDFDEFKSDLYIIYGSNAYLVHTVLKIVATDESTLPGIILYEKAGEVTIEIMGKEDDGDYTPYAKALDIDAISAALDDEKSNIKLVAFSKGSEVTFDGTGDGTNGGFWVNEQGQWNGWNSAACIFIMETVSNDPSSISVMAMPGGTLKVDVPVTVPCFLISDNTQKYYQINIKFVLESEKNPDTEVEQKDWVLSGTLEYDVQMLPTEDTQSVTTQLDMDLVSEIVGGNPDQIGAKSLYTWKESIEEFNPESLTNSYNCTPHPGFWMSADGKTPLDWSADCAYGMTLNVSSGIVTWYRHYMSSLKAGAQFEGKFYIVNKFTGKVCELVFNIAYVDSRQEIEVVGTENVEIVLSEENFNGDYYTASNDFSKVFEALNINADLYPTGIWYGQNERGKFTVIPSFEGEDAGFDANGVFIAEGVDAIAAFAVGYDAEEGAFVANVFDEITDATKYSTKVAYEYDGKRYVFNIKIGSAAALAISNVNSEVKNSDVYDMSGRLVRKANQSANGLMRGIYMIGGKKVMIK